eukprot:scaffold1711_cov258-Prasinococcus_capsulatus_cf.AAC.6
MRTRSQGRTFEDRIGHGLPTPARCPRRPPAKRSTRVWRQARRFEIRGAKPTREYGKGEYKSGRGWRAPGPVRARAPGATEHGGERHDEAPAPCGGSLGP